MALWGERFSVHMELHCIYVEQQPLVSGAHRNQEHCSCVCCVSHLLLYYFLNRIFFLITFHSLFFFFLFHDPALLFVIEKTKQEHWQGKGLGQGLGKAQAFNRWHANRPSDRCKYRPSSKMQTCTTCWTVKHSDKDQGHSQWEHEHWTCDKNRNYIDRSLKKKNYLWQTNVLQFCVVFKK